MMEVELKARVADPKATEAAISSFARYERSFDKEDLYFLAPPLPAPPHRTDAAHRIDAAGEEDRGRAFRLRRDGGKAYVTFKQKTRSGGIEVNEEKEFELSDHGLFEELCARIGCSIAVRKRKTGKAFRFGAFLIELCEVAGLGWFCEIETLVDSAEPGAIAAAKDGLLAVLKDCGLSPGDLEERYYTEMLAELGR